MRYFLALLTVIYFLCSVQAWAFSEYGAFCKDNDDCVSCRNDTKCLICIHDCENMYGDADGPLLRFGDKKRNPERYKQACTLKLAKWCNAQCWDPDDPTEPSTKPLCRVNIVGERRQGGRVYWNPSREEEE